MLKILAVIEIFISDFSLCIEIEIIPMDSIYSWIFEIILYEVTCVYF